MAMSTLSQSSIKKPFKQVVKEKWANFKYEAYLAFGGKKKLRKPQNVVCVVPH
eukprot:CAMPEP_0176366180 /NCGR_PEP_ID=MMETSP0126-20121128/20998_1 /TAXON_ID=141414 ORGANISM="Strombidinopsis acuminatum, Strain SPMC142" /NCGR_SAMPLE_ID=MMETSP0126 /ASSEMBLY_ACC=CAM_ASM_000229 /LENGTH=52 /DNA_ID=CAMNT_0017723495 /DNA_START=200 /DNA_END=358 /DNA_ORIENTATION=+